MRQDLRAQSAPEPRGKPDLPPLRLDRWELGGALGDVGVLFPIAIALITLNGMNPTAVFLTAGLLYAGAGLYYRLPIPVQPLKAMSALALALHVGPAAIAAAGALMGVILLLLGATGLAGHVARIFPWPLVRGIQLGIGLLLMKTGWGLISGPLFGVPGAAHAGGPALASVALGGLALLALVRFAPGHRVPTSLAVLGAGAALGLALGGDLPRLQPGPAPLAPALPAGTDLALALTALVLPQLPLTLGNAIVATADAARCYFGSQAHRVTARALAVSLGLANCLAGVIQGMPVCHGAGGLTAHYRFGARTGAAPLMMGLICLALAAGLGRSAAAFLGLTPLPVLGAFLAYVGLEHAVLVADLQTRRDYLVALGAGATALVTGNMAWAMAAGALLLAAWRAGAPAQDDAKGRGITC